MTCHLYLIATKVIKPWEFDMNLVYVKNENTVGERKNIWLAMDVGVETNPNSSSNTLLAYILGGLIW